MNPNEATALLIQLCSQTKTPDFCVATIDSDPRAAGADLRGLARIALDFSSNTTVANANFVAVMLKNATDVGVKRGFKHCTVNYGGTVYALEHQSADLDNGNYKELRELVGIAAENTRDCERAFVQGPTHWSPMTNMNEKLWKLADMSDAFVGLFLRSTG